MAELLYGIHPLFYIAFVCFVIALIVAWIVLPFAIIGTKPILTKLLAEQRQTNALLEEMADRQVPARPAPVAPRYLQRTGS